MRKGLGITALFLGAITTILGFMMRNGDQYKQEMYFEGFYGSDTINLVHTMIAVGIIMVAAGLILVLIGNKRNANSDVENHNHTSSTPKAVINDKQDIVTNNDDVSGIASLLRRAEIFLEDGDFKSADKYFDRVLDIDPECARAYFGRMLAELKLKSEDELTSSGIDITENANYKKAVRFAGDAYREKLEQLDPETLKKKENDRKEGIYNNAVELMKGAATERSYTEAAKLFRSIDGYKDSESLAEICEERAENLRIQNEKERAEALEQERERIAKERQNKRKREIAAISVVSALAIIFVIAMLIENVLIPSNNYNQANKLFENKKYDQAAAVFLKLDDYKDSREMVSECSYRIANDLLSNKEYDQALIAFLDLKDYKDSSEKVQECHYNKAVNLLDNEKYDEAIDEFSLVEKYKDSTEKIRECHYNKGLTLFNNKQYDQALDEFSQVWGIYKDIEEKIQECHYNKGLILFSDKQYDEAAAEFASVLDYKDSKAKVLECNNKFRTYTNDAYKFYIDYPYGFELSEEDLGGEDKEFRIFNPNTTYGEDLPDLYMQLRVYSITQSDTIEDFYDYKLNDVTNEYTNVHYKELQGNEFIIYWNDSRTKLEYCYRAVVDENNEVVYFFYQEYEEENKQICEPIARKIINSFKILSDQA